MRQIINGKWYDTNTAELIYTEYNTHTHAKRDYYMTKKRAFFCHYVSVGKIELVTEAYMMELLAYHDPDKYIEIFGDVEEG